jgi:MipA family protein
MWGRCIRAAATAAAALALSGAACSAELSPNTPLASSSNWTLTVGDEGPFEPIFDGSKDDTLRPHPLFDLRRAGTPKRFRSPRDGSPNQVTIGFGATHSFDIKQPW